MLTVFAFDAPVASHCFVLADGKDWIGGPSFIDPVAYRVGGVTYH